MFQWFFPIFFISLAISIFLPFPTDNIPVLGTLVRVRHVDTAITMLLVSAVLWTLFGIVAFVMSFAVGEDEDPLDLI